MDLIYNCFYGRVKQYLPYHFIRQRVARAGVLLFIIMLYRLGLPHRFFVLMVHMGDNLILFCLLEGKGEVAGFFFDRYQTVFILFLIFVASLNKLRNWRSQPFYLLMLFDRFVDEDIEEIHLSHTLGIWSVG